MTKLCSNCKWADLSLNDSICSECDCTNDRWEEPVLSRDQKFEALTAYIEAFCEYKENPTKLNKMELDKHKDMLMFIF